jgi:dipeptidyl-peptidase-4
MGTPAENPEGYKTASVFSHAGNLEGGLLFPHGLRDENVHTQNTFQLAALLEDLNKDFELMIYPESWQVYQGAKREHDRRLDLWFIYKVQLNNLSLRKFKTKKL